MLDVRYIAEHLDEVRAGLARRGFDDAETLDRLVSLTEARKSAVQKLEALQQQRNQAAAEMGKVKDKGSAEFQERRTALRALGDQISALDTATKEQTAALTELAMGLPNLPHSSTPDGLDESQNVELRVVGDKPEFAFKPKDHVDLGTDLGILDFERGAKLSGARFVALRGMGARLERALMQFMLDRHADDHGYTEVWVPALVKEEALRGTGQLPKFAEDLFRIANSAADPEADADQEPSAEGEPRNLYLVPTAEVPVTNLHAGEILDALPVRYCAYTPCFRSEAGAHGRDTRGMIRQHQFDKVELVQFVSSDEAEAEAALDALTGHAEAILQALGLHYRVVQLCAGDLGFAAQKCFDIEVWLPSQGRYREISSCSWFGDFQARRMKIRHRPAAASGAKKKPKPALVHTLNGSGLAIGRTLVALLEQHQTADGDVVIPEALRPYVGGREAIRA